MSQKHAAQLFKAVKEDQVLKERLKAASDPEGFISLLQLSS
ncbi:Nif11-like leader peptide family natural product precursor [Fischerella thermalis]|jgi:hypothetical protein|nr:Nif11-like leader peptide family natural product precursor [Fischerella thermalis]